MCGGCAARRAHLVEAGRAVLRADATTAARSAQALGRNMAQAAQALAVRLAHPARRP